MANFKENFEQMNHFSQFFLLTISLQIFLAFLISLFILFSSKFLPPKLPLFYSLPWGEKQLATHQQLFILPAILVLITLINIAVAWQLHLSQSFFKKILIFSSLVTSMILVITFIKIILIFI
ncbi:hypothetical protein HYS94_03125 [Candidatus Daviesbacteria bacterium]|nr:hypothetical protein [Candidatus Daviesbacteria bacterium]MBI4035353.1 hypothetical protein [Candidatus Daviesbacteria bacterium]